MIRLTKASFLLIFILQFKACVLTTVISTAERVLNGQDVELVCTHSTNIASTSTVYVNWNENGLRQGNIDNTCDDAFDTVNTTQYNFTCPSNRNYTWTIKNVQESRNGTVWTCEIAIDSLTYITSGSTTIYVISPITSVSIDGNANISADAKSQTTVSCTTSIGRPVSTIHWYFDAGTPSNTSDDEEITSTSEPVFDFRIETTSGSVTITAESNRNGWGIYATANNTESMTPIKSSNAVTLTVTEIQTSTASSTVISSTSDSIPDDSKICVWCVIIPWWWCIVLIVISILCAGCIVGVGAIYKCCPKYIPRKWPCSSSKHNDDKGNSSVSQVKMDGMSSEKSDAAQKELSRNNGGEIGLLPGVQRTPRNNVKPSPDARPNQRPQPNHPTLLKSEKDQNPLPSIGTKTSPDARPSQRPQPNPPTLLKSEKDQDPIPSIGTKPSPDARPSQRPQPNPPTLLMSEKDQDPIPSIGTKPSPDARPSQRPQPNPPTLLMSEKDQDPLPSIGTRSNGKPEGDQRSGVSYENVLSNFNEDNNQLTSQTQPQRLVPIEFQPAKRKKKGKSKRLEP